MFSVTDMDMTNDKWQHHFVSQGVAWHTFNSRSSGDNLVAMTVFLQYLQCHTTLILFKYSTKKWFPLTSRILDSLFYYRHLCQLRTPVGARMRFVSAPQQMWGLIVCVVGYTSGRHSIGNAQSYWSVHTIAIPYQSYIQAQILLYFPPIIPYDLYHSGISSITSNIYKYNIHKWSHHSSYWS